MEHFRWKEKCILQYKHSRLRLLRSSYCLLTAMTFHYVSLGICFCFDFWGLDVAVCTGPGFTEISPLRINSLCVAMELL